MSRKSKFNPEIIRVKLNPEQAVLSCDCMNFDRRVRYHGGSRGFTSNAAGTYCEGRVAGDMDTAGQDKDESTASTS